MSEFESGPSEYQKMGEGFKTEFRQPEQQKQILEALNQAVAEAK
jgi:hypothetical protein